MHPAMPLIATLASALGLALLLGLLAVRLRLPALVGYLMAGVVIGPFTPGFVADVGLASQLAEVGVMLLMFGVGLHFSLHDLMSVRRIAVPGAVVQMGVAAALGAALASSWGWGPAGAWVFGLSLSVASTVVLLRALEARGELQSPDGRIAVGWLVVEDLAMVLALVMLPVLAGNAGQGGTPVDALTAVLRTLLAVAAFVALMLLGGRRLLPWLLWQIARTGSRELFTLAVIAVAVALAYGASLLFGVSMALGAFFAGLVLRESEFSHRAADESLPFRDAFAVLFFVSVGMLFDPRVLLAYPLQILAVAAVIMVGKSLAAAGLVLLLGHPLRTALTVAASLAQIGEFSFILMAMAAQLKLLPGEAQSLVVAGALLSIALNPLLFSCIPALERWLMQVWPVMRKMALREDPLSALPQDTPEQMLQRQVVLVGHGRVGQQVARKLRDAGQAVVVIENQRERVESLRAQGLAAVLGDASDPAVMVQAHAARASLLIISTPDATALRPMIGVARALQPQLPILARAEDEDTRRWLQGMGVEAIGSGQALGEVLGERGLHHLAPKPVASSQA